jgi:hypothetical protein
LHSATIARGGEHWFIGSPVASQPGTVALAQTPEIKLVFREEDIREVRKHGERYVVRVAADANMLVSHEQTMKAAASRCDCASGEDGAKPGTTRQAERGRIDPDADVNYIEVMPCWWRFNCYTINIPLLGPTRVCIPTGLYCS